MVTLANVKAYLRITDTDATRDALISLLIPVVYADIIEECNNLFRVTGYAFVTDEMYFDVTGTTYKILVDAGGFTDMGYPTGGNIIVSGSRLNDGIFTISAQADTYLQTTEPIVDELQTTAGYSVRVDLCNFPKQLEMIASMMIGEQLNNPTGPELTAESLGNWSGSYKVNNASGSYSDRVLGKLKPWKNMRTGRGTIQWHINENRTYWPESPKSAEGGSVLHGN